MTRFEFKSRTMREETNETKADSSSVLFYMFYTVGMRNVGRLSCSSNAERLDSSCWLSESEKIEPSLLGQLGSSMIFLCSCLSVDEDEILWRLLASVELAHDVVIVSNSNKRSVRRVRTKVESLTSTQWIDHHRIGYLWWRWNQRWWSIVRLPLHSAKGR